jgi:hypothetical protein
MNRYIWLRRAATALPALFLLLATLPAPAAAPTHSAVLPVVLAPPGVIAVADAAGLRAAIATANAAGQMPTINLTADITIYAALPPLDNPGAGVATIRGNGHTVDGSGHGPILTVGAATTVVVEQLTLVNGLTGDCGGGILVYGDLTLRRSQVRRGYANRGGGICALADGGQATVRLEQSSVSDNAAGDGGGIYARASNSGGGVSLWIVDSTVSGNRATGDYGGGIFAYASTGAVGTRIIRSTVSFNSAPTAAGLFNLGAQDAAPVRSATAFATATIENSTFSGNVALEEGGAIGNYTLIWPYPERWSQWPEAGASIGPAAPKPLPPGIGFGQVKLVNSTITGNGAGRGSGIFNGELGQVEMSGTIVSDNRPDGGDCAGGIGSLGYNLDGDGTCGLGQPTDLPRAEADLQLLAPRPPGVTATHALGPNSAARDRIPAGAMGCGAAATDQRGVPRPQPAGGRCDMGAYEVEQP